MRLPIVWSSVEVRKAIRAIGKILVSVGILLFLFVGYQLWGTGLAEARGQRDLATRFHQRALTSGPTAPSPSNEPPPTTTLPPFDLGDAVAMIEIPKIDVTKFVVEGVDPENLKVGPGHYPGTPLPGERGNAAIAGHRTTYGAPFYDLNELSPGDEIVVTTAAGRFEYEVSETLIVDPMEGVWVINNTTDDRLTLTTCHPRFSAAQRLVVVGKLKTPAVLSASSIEPTSALSKPRADLNGGLSGQPLNNVPAIAWGLLAGAIWVAGWFFGRMWRRWPAYAITVVPFLVALFAFYDNVARLLPADF
jgi:sortase A